MPTPVQIVLAGESIVCAGLRVGFEAHDEVSVAAVATPDEFRELAQGDGQVVVMPDPADPSQLVRRLAAVRGVRPDVPVLVIINTPDPERAFAALDVGATGVMVLDATMRELVVAAIATADGGMPIDPRLTRHVIDRVTDAARRSGSLTLREEDVVERVWRGLSNKQIGRELGISEPTVKVYLTRVYQRLGVTSRTEAAMWFDARHRPAEDTLAS